MKTSQVATKVLKGFIKYKANKSAPLFASYNVTGRCNMRCVFCEWWKHPIPELSTKDALAAIDAVCSLGVPFFDLSGGEPLLRKDLKVLAKRVASYGCLVSMNTNGTLLDENRIKEVADVFDTVVVSLDGPKKIHDQIRGVAGTYEKATKAIRLLKSHGVKVGTNSVATKYNIDVLPKFIQELHSTVDFVQVQPMHPYPLLPEDKPTKQQVSKLLDYLLDVKQSDSSFLAVPAQFLKGFYDYFDGKAPKICHAGKLYVAINPSGKLLACPARSDIVLGDTLNGSVKESLKHKQENKGWQQVSACKGCWLECTVGVSMVLDNPLKEVPHLVGLWKSS